MKIKQQPNTDGISCRGGKINYTDFGLLLLYGKCHFN